MRAAAVSFLAPERADRHTSRVACFPLRGARVLLIGTFCLVACAGPKPEPQSDANQLPPDDSGEVEDEDAGAPSTADTAIMDASAARDASLFDANVLAANDGGRLPPGPAVEVTPEGAGALQFHGSDICLLNERGDIQCRNLPPVWKPYRTGPFKAMALDGFRGCAIRPDDSVTCWTDSDGDGLCPGAVSSCVSEGRPPADKFARISLYAQTACGVTLEGRLLCWGAKDEARTTPPAGNDFTSVQLDSGASCALRRDGSAACWALSSSSNATAAAVGQGKQVAVSLNTICMLSNDGTVNCVGSYSDLELDKQAHDLAQISVDRYAMCGLTKDGAARCWSLQSDTFKRVAPPVGPFKSILATTQYACGLRGDGQMECWGYFWGNGSSPESCLLNSASLSVDGKPVRSESLGIFNDDRAPADAGLRSGVASEHGYLLIDGSGASGRDLRAATADAGVNVRSSLWLFEQSDTSAGDIYCSGPNAAGRIQRQNDELLIDLNDLALLGHCPGTEAVAGSLSTCANDVACASKALIGTLRGESKNVAQRYEQGRQLGFADGTILIAFTLNQPKWSVLITPPDAAGLSEVICIGDNSIANGAWTLGNFTSLGRCKGGGTHTVKGCLR